MPKKAKKYSVNKVSMSSKTNLLSYVSNLFSTMLNDTNNKIEPLVDLQAIFLFASDILSSFGMILNGFLLYMIFFKTSKKISAYKKVLIQNCFFDVLLIFFNGIVKGHTDYKYGAFYFIASDLLKVIPYPYNCILAGCWLFTLFCCVTSIPVQFIYRYVLIVRETTISNKKYFGLLFIATATSSSYAAVCTYSCWPENEAHDRLSLLLKNDIYYFRGIPFFMVAEIQRWPLRITFAYGYFLVSVSYGITIFSSWKVWKKLKDQENYFSAQTRLMHNQMTKTLILQATVPLIFELIPIGCAITSTIALINVQGLGIIVNFMCCWIPIANPLVTIFSVQSYRQIVISFLQKSLSKRLLSRCCCFDEPHVAPLTHTNSAS